jgi:hypothetical protein
MTSTPPEAARGSHYRAFALPLSSSFELPGLRPTPAAPGALRLKLSTRTAVERLWSGGNRQPVWSTAIDGRPCTMRIGRSGDYLMAYGQDAVFLLSPDGRSLRCAPTDRTAASWQRFLLDTVLWSASSLSGVELLHASAVRGSAGVVAFAGFSGGGKTSLAAELMRRDADLFADDILALPSTQGELRVHPGPALMNLPCAQGKPDGLGAVLARFDDEFWVSVERAATTPDPLAALCLLRRRAGVGLALHRLPPNVLNVLPFALGFPHLRGRMRRRFVLYARLAAEVPAYELTAPVGASPGAIADLVEPLVSGAAAARERAA